VAKVRPATIMKVRICFEVSPPSALWMMGAKRRGCGKIDSSLFDADWTFEKCLNSLSAQISSINCIWNNSSCPFFTHESLSILANIPPQMEYSSPQQEQPATPISIPIVEGMKQATENIKSDITASPAPIDPDWADDGGTSAPIGENLRFSLRRLKRRCLTQIRQVEGNILPGSGTASGMVME
jgi:hypothetical protein